MTRAGALSRERKPSGQSSTVSGRCRRAATSPLPRPGWRRMPSATACSCCAPAPAHVGPGDAALPRAAGGRAAVQSGEGAAPHPADRSPKRRSGLRPRPLLIPRPGLRKELEARRAPGAFGPSGRTWCATKSACRRSRSNKTASASVCALRWPAPPASRSRATGVALPPNLRELARPASARVRLAPASVVPRIRVAPQPNEITKQPDSRCPTWAGRAKGRGLGPTHRLAGLEAPGPDPVCRRPSQGRSHRKL